MSGTRIKVIFASMAVLGMMLITSCDPSKKYEEDEENAIQSYLLDNFALQFEHKPSGLYYLEVKAGTGNLPVKSDTAYVKYTGKFLDGTVFDTNVGKPDTLIFPVDEGWMIPGFDECVLYMRPGGKALTLVPSKLAYGPTGYYIIGGYTPLLFDIELVKLVKGPNK